MDEHRGSADLRGRQGVAAGERLIACAIVVSGEI